MLLPAEYQLLRVRYRPLRGRFSFLQRAHSPDAAESDASQSQKEDAPQEPDIFLHDSNACGGLPPKQGDFIFGKVTSRPEDDRLTVVHAIQPHFVCNMLWRNVVDLTKAVDDLRARVSAIESLEETAMDQSTALSDLFVNVTAPSTAPPSTAPPSYPDNPICQIRGT